MRIDDLTGLDGGRLLELMSALVAMLTLPQQAANHVDGLAAPIGQGEEWRITQAINTWEANSNIRCLLIANGNPAEETYLDITVAYLRSLGLRRLEGVHIQPDPAPNTALQAAWIVDRVGDLDLRHIALVVSPYHLPRAYLTVLKALIRNKNQVPVIPYPVATPADLTMPETGATAYDLLPGEVDRILRYMDEGWVATPRELRAYLGWLWSHHRSLLVQGSV